jgi:Porin subfamily
MKLFKSLLLASATGLVAVSGASAADLGAKKPSPVEYVRACYNPLWGTSGGFVIPGTQTCLRVFGTARFDYQYQQQFTRVGAPSGFRGGAIIGLDAITPSEYGNVRAFAQVGLIYRTGNGNQRTGTGTRQGTFIDGGFNGNNGGNGSGGTEVVFSGFIQFAGITAGRTASFFDPFFTPEIIGVTFRSSPGNVNLIAYTAALGNGITATISAEDPTTRRYGVLNGTLLAANAAGTGALDYTAAGLTGAQGGIAVPNIVAALQVDQAWGSAKLAGVLTNVRPNFQLTPVGGVVSSIPSTKYGFAVQGALKINLPMIAAGDNFVITGVYGQGATSYVFSNQFGGSVSRQGAGGANFDVGDAAFDNVTGSLKLSKAWAVAAGFQHFWTPTVSSTIFGSYAAYDAPFNPVNIRDLNRDAKMYSVGVNTIWTPVRGLAIALEGVYLNFDPKGRVYDVNKNHNHLNVAQTACSNTAGFCFTKSSDSVFATRLRITRDF